MYICTVNTGEVFYRCNIVVVKIVSDPVRRSRVTKVLDMINRAGGGPLQAFYRSSTTFTSAMLLSSKFHPYIRVGLRDKVLAPPR